MNAATGQDGGAEAIAADFVHACAAELTALKPGNVHVFAPGHRMTVDDFTRSAEVAAPHIAAGGARVGERVLRAVTATLDAVGQNTNLGIILLCAPIARAAEAARAPGGGVIAELRHCLDELDVEDADKVFRAIALANPGGLGTSGRNDVREPARVPLGEAMAEAAERDRIARQYVTGFADVIDIGLPCLQGLPGEPDPAAVTRLYLTFLSAFPDSHIMRKFGAVVAADVQSEAAIALSRLDRPESRDELLRLDARWKQRGINPGTSADLTVAALFLSGVMHSR